MKALAFFGILASFLFGVMAGLAILTMFYTFLVVKSTKKDHTKLGLQEVTIPEEVKTLLEQAIKDYKSDCKVRDEGNFVVAFDLSKRLINDISLHYFPESSHPQYELSIEETLNLNRYINKRIDLLLSRRGIKALRNLRVSQIVKAVELKHKLSNSKFFTFAFKTKKLLGVVGKVINIINPVYWFRVIVMQGGIGLSINMINKQILTIVTEESCRIYSKSLFTPEVEIEEIIEEIDEVREAL